MAENGIFLLAVDRNFRQWLDFYDQSEYIIEPIEMQLRAWEAP